MKRPMYRILWIFKEYPQIVSGSNMDICRISSIIQIQQICSIYRNAVNTAFIKHPYFTHTNTAVSISGSR
jgi:hypothetical protein